MRNLIVFVLALFGCYHLTGQVEKTVLRPIERGCPAPGLVAQAVIQYQQGAKLFIEFSGLKNDQQLVLRTTDGSFSKQVKSFESKLLVDGLPYDKNYVLQTANTCGEVVEVASVSTFQQDFETYGIALSDRMYDAVLAFQRLGDVPLIPFLEDLDQVSPYEKIAFIQQFFFPREKLAVDQGTQLPAFQLKDGTELLGQDCRCALLVAMSQLAVPGTMNGDPNGNLMPAFESDSLEFGSPWPFDDDWQWVESRYTAGPSKQHFLRNHGWNGNEIHETTYAVENLGEGAPHRAQLRYNYACINGSQIPKECDCSKNMRVYYHYDTRTKASTHIGNGLADKDASALTEDLAIVTLETGDNIEILDARSLLVADTCSSRFNRQWVLDYLDLAQDVAIFFLTDSTSNYAELVDSLVNDISDLIGEPLVFFGSACGSITKDATLVHGTHPVELKPNQPIVLNLFSYSHQVVTGKREWDSKSFIHSDFYLTGFVPGGYYDDEEKNCCTDKYGNWVLSSLGGPLTVPNLQSLVRAILNDGGVWGPGGAGITISTMYGLRRFNIENCGDDRPFAPIDPTTDRNNPELSQNGNTNDPVQVFVYDVYGKLVFSQKSVTDMESIKAKIRDEKLLLAPGAYFIQIQRGKFKETVKVVIAE